MGWQQESKILSSDEDSLDFFGISVSISPENIVVCAYGNDEDAEEATYHTGLELKFPSQHIAFRLGKSIEEQENPKAERINYGISLWYKSIEFISTIGYSKVYVFSEEGPFESHRTSFELRYGIK